MEWFAIVKEFGAAVAVIASFLSITFLCVKWILAWLDKGRVDSKEDKEKLWCLINQQNGIINGYQANLIEVTNMVKTTNEEMRLAHQYQRQEHKVMINTLKRLENKKEEVEDNV